MPPGDATRRAQRLAALRERYGAELPGRLDGIEAAWRATAPDCDPAQRETLHRLVHSLAGSAGTFGFSALSEAARVLEVRLSPDAGPCDQEAVEAALRALRLATTQSAPPAPPLPTPPREPARADEAARVFVIEDDELLARELAAQLSRYGYLVTTFTSATEALASSGERPHAIVCDIVLPEGRVAGPELVTAIKAQFGVDIPTIAISTSWDWPSRLAAARAGVDAYLVKPLDLPELVEQLERLTHPREAEPFRVLVVEDTEVLAAHYAEVLTGAGMKVTTVSRPSQLLAAMSEVNPELVLMDLYMPECSGTEAAQVIRQDPRFTDLPIVFLSTETARRLQLAALQTGADDFLQKPIADEELIGAVSLRASRFRDLRGLIRQDAMTRLLNHVSFTLQLEHELARSVRLKLPLAVCMVDLDHFKRVNDTHGHGSGDRVIRSAAQLLRRRLRKSDVVGRYGGEEFAIIFPECTVEQAKQVVDALRVQFSEVRHLTPDGTVFSVTFSAGIAAATPGASPAEAMAAADRALYEAKRAGRNRVVGAG